MSLAAPQRPCLYVDTSAYLCILLAEDGWHQIADQLAEGELVSSVLLVLEANRNLIRLTREGTLTPDQYTACMERVREDQSLFRLRDLSLDLCGPPPMPPITTPRTLDLAHLRTALWFHAETPLTRFVTMDSGQRLAARDVGLPV